MTLQDSEIASVKQLGESIGYGNMMEIAHSLWCEELLKFGEGVENGAFYPVLLCELSKKRQKELAPSRMNYRKIIKEYLNK
jgi:hypothetical protein